MNSSVDSSGGITFTIAVCITTCSPIESMVVSSFVDITSSRLGFFSRTSFLIIVWWFSGHFMAEIIRARWLVMFVLFSTVNTYLSNHHTIFHLLTFFHASPAVPGSSYSSRLYDLVFEAFVTPVSFSTRNTFLLKSRLETVIRQETFSMSLVSWALMCLFRSSLKVFTLHSSFSVFIFSSSSNVFLGSLGFHLGRICIWFSFSPSERKGINDLKDVDLEVDTGRFVILP